MNGPSVTEMRAILREATARVGLAIDSVGERTPEIEALAHLYDGTLGAWCWCEKPHRGSCPDDATVVEALDEQARIEAEQEDAAAIPPMPCEHCAIGDDE